MTNIQKNYHYESITRISYNRRSMGHLKFVSEYKGSIYIHEWWKVKNRIITSFIKLTLDNASVARSQHLKRMWVKKIEIRERKILTFYISATKITKKDNRQRDEMILLCYYVKRKRMIDINLYIRMFLKRTPRESRPT